MPLTNEPLTELNQQFINAILEGKNKEALSFLEAGADVNTPTFPTETEIRLSDYLTPNGTNAEGLLSFKNTAATNITFPVDWGRLTIGPGVEYFSRSDIMGTITKYYDINGFKFTGRNQYTALHIAALRGDEELFHALVAKGGNIHYTATGNLSLLHVAAISGNVNIIETLISLGIDIEAKCARDFRVRNKSATDSEKTAFDLAAECGHVEAMDKLLESNTKMGIYPSIALAEATHSGHLEAVKYLIEQGASCQDFDVEVKYIGEEGTEKVISRKISIFNLAIKTKEPKVELFQILKANGADINALDEYGNTVLQNLAYQHCYNFDSEETKAKFVEYFTTLVDLGADPYTPMGNGKTLLHNLIGYNSYVNITKLIIENSTEDQLNTRDNEGRTAIEYALNDGMLQIHSFESILMLARAGMRLDKAKINFQKVIDDIINTEILLNDEILELLGDGFNSFLTLENARKVKQYISIDKLTDIVKFWLTKLPEPDRSVFFNESFYNFLTKHQEISPEAFREFLALGIDINSSYEGDTFLHHIITDYTLTSANKIKALKLLLTNGTDINALNSWGGNCLFYLEVWEDKDLRAFLLENGANPIIELEAINAFAYIISQAALYNKTEILTNILPLIPAEERVTYFNKALYSTIAFNPTINIAGLKYLITQGADVNFTDPRYGLPLIHMLIKNNMGTADKIEVLKLLITYKANINCLDPFFNSNCLFLKEAWQNEEIIDFLLKHGADRTAVDDEGNNFFQYLLRKYTSEATRDEYKTLITPNLVTKVIRLQVDINHANNEDGTALSCLASALINQPARNQANIINCIKLLLEEGATVNEELNAEVENCNNAALKQIFAAAKYADKVGSKDIIEQALSEDYHALVIKRVSKFFANHELAPGFIKYIGDARFIPNDLKPQLKSIYKIQYYTDKIAALEEPALETGIGLDVQMVNNLEKAEIIKRLRLEFIKHFPQGNIYQYADKKLIKDLGLSDTIKLVADEINYKYEEIASELLANILGDEVLPPLTDLLDKARSNFTQEDLKEILSPSGEEPISTTHQQIIKTLWSFKGEPLELIKTLILGGEFLPALPEGAITLEDFFAAGIKSTAYKGELLGERHARIYSLLKNIQKNPLITQHDDLKAKIDIMLSKYESVDAYTSLYYNIINNSNEIEPYMLVGYLGATEEQEDI